MHFWKTLNGVLRVKKVGDRVTEESLMHFWKTLNGVLRVKKVGDRGGPNALLENT